MRKIFSLLTAAILTVLSFNLTIVYAEISPITATAENGKYTWDFGINDEGRIFMPVRRKEMLYDKLRIIMQNRR